MVVAWALGELVPVLALVAVVAVWGPAGSTEGDLFARRVGAWVGPIAGAVTLFGVTRWAGRVAMRPALQGAVIGVAVALTDLALLRAMGEPFVPLFFVSNGGKVLAGLVGGWLAGRSVGHGEEGQ